MKTYALIEDEEVVDFSVRDEISDEEWKSGDWRVVKDNSVGVDRDKFAVSSHFDIDIHPRKVIKTHDITPLNTKTKRVIAKL